MSKQILYLCIPLSCLLASIIPGFFGTVIGRTYSHRIAILGIALSFIGSTIAAIDVFQGNSFNENLYTWASIGNMQFHIGFLIDRLSVTMMLVVTFVSLMVHVYTIGYMKDDSGYSRFFSYIALFTFAMLMLVMSNNFLQLFFGWEAVGLVSYLLIGFWYEKESAVRANLKAFLINRVGDLGFLLGIAAVFVMFGTLDYNETFEGAINVANKTLSIFNGVEIKWITAICLLLFVGAMGKSAQIPLHVWLPDSMEGPTPISALIHAATMVTAGIFLVARLAPLYNLSTPSLSIILVIGSLTALLMAFVAIVQNDIKRVVAYSTLSQLGYMTIALGVSSYSLGIFHLVTHAFFKALLFLAAGSVIVAIHHQQDMRNMGGLRKKLPVTYLVCLIGTLALVGIPPFSGFFSKEAIIMAVSASDIPGAGFAYFASLLTVLLTAFYSFRLVFMTFHGKPSKELVSASFDVKESPWVITMPLIILAMLAVLSGLLLIGPVSFNLWNMDEGSEFIWNQSLFLTAAVDMLFHVPYALPFWLAVLGSFMAWICYCYRTELPEMASKKFKHIYIILLNKYGFDRFYTLIFVRGSILFGKKLWLWIDDILIDQSIVNGSARIVGSSSSFLRRIQTGLVNHYAFTMIIGLVCLMTWLLVS